MLDQSVREALQAELEHLQTRHAKDATRIEHLTAILEPEDPLEMFQLRLPMPLPQSRNGDGTLAGVGLNESIRRVLAQHPGGLVPRELANRLEQSGYQPKGKLRTRQLLYGELNRLKRARLVEKRGQRYRLVTASTQQESEQP